MNRFNCAAWMLSLLPVIASAAEPTLPWPDAAPTPAALPERLPVVVFVHGGTDTRAQPKDWGSYQSWGRLVAASGMVAVTFTHRLGFPETRVREAARDLVAYYPFMDIRQSELHRAAETEQTRDAFSNILHVAKPGRKTPLYLARAGRDEIPTLLDSVDRFTAAALVANYPLTLQNHPEGPHGFDNQTNDARSREIVLATLAYLKHHLLQPLPAPKEG